MRAGQGLREHLQRGMASALSDAAARMLKLRGRGQMPTLWKALNARRPDTDNGAVLKAA